MKYQKDFINIADLLLYVLALPAIKLENLKVLIASFTIATYDVVVRPNESKALEPLGFHIKARDEEL